MSSDASSSGDYEDLFPAKLHYVLERAEQDGHGDVITWQPHGKAFLVNDRERFVQDFLPNSFRQRKWASFQRQLNHYGFTRMTKDRNAYYHPFFVKGERELCRHILRDKYRVTKADEEPNFYSGPLDVEVDGDVNANDVASRAVQRTESRRPAAVATRREFPDDSLPRVRSFDRGAPLPLVPPPPIVVRSLSSLSHFPAAPPVPIRGLVGAGPWESTLWSTFGDVRGRNVSAHSLPSESTLWPLRSLHSSSSSLPTYGSGPAASFVGRSHSLFATPPRHLFVGAVTVAPAPAPPAATQEDDDEVPDGGSSAHR